MFCVADNLRSVCLGSLKLAPYNKTLSKMVPLVVVLIFLWHPTFNRKLNNNKHCPYASPSCVDMIKSIFLNEVNFEKEGLIHNKRKTEKIKNLPSKK